MRKYQKIGTYDPRPRELDDNPKYQKLSTAAKELYTKIYSRCCLSATKGDRYRDERGFYAYYTVEEAMAQLNCGKDKAGNTFKELEKVGLIQRRRCGYSRACRVYAKDLLGRLEKATSKSRENRTDKGLEIRKSEVGKTDLSNTDKKENDISNANTATIFEDWFAAERVIKENISYDILIQELPQDRVDYLLKILVTKLCSTQEYVAISKAPIPIQKVRQELLQINDLHIRHVCRMLDETTLDIRNMEAFCLSLLWNAEMNMELSAQAAVNRDYASGKL